MTYIQTWNRRLIEVGVTPRRTSGSPRRAHGSPIEHPDALIDAHSIVLDGPDAPGGETHLDRAATSYRYWRCDGVGEASPPQVAIGTRERWYPTQWIKPGVAALMVSGPDASRPAASVALALDSHPTWIKITLGGVDIVQATRRLTVR